MKKSYFIVVFLLGVSTQILAQVDYPSQIQPILTSNCNSCHSQGQNSFNSSSYAAVMASVSPSNRYDKNHVIAGDPDGSPLVDKIEPDPDFGNRMPTGGSLSNNEISLIRTWIEEGANAVATNNEIEEENPTEFRLLGNYPNPFNPGTNIQFQVPEAAQYSISIYTVHGQLISEQVGRASIGTNTVAIDLGNRPTGVYIYQLRARVNGTNQVIGSGNMTLIK